MIPFIRKVGFAVMTTLLLLQASFAIAADPVLTREVILKDDRTGAWVINPNTIINLEDGGFVVAGNIASNQSAWAVRTDSQGNVLWRYDLPIRERRPHAELPDFQGATEMPDGSVYLCGHMPRPIGVSKPALLVHLDKAGGSPSERLMSPGDLSP